MTSAEEETSSEVLKSKPDKFTSEVLKTNYSSVVCHSSALSIRYFPPPFCISSLLFIITFSCNCFFQCCNLCNLFLLFLYLLFWQDTCMQPSILDIDFKRKILQTLSLFYSISVFIVNLPKYLILIY